MNINAYWHKAVSLLKANGTSPAYSDIENMTISWVNVMSVVFVLMAIPYFVDADLIFTIINIIALIFNILPLYFNYLKKPLMAKIVLIFPPIIVTTLSVLLFYTFSWMAIFMVVMQLAIFAFLPFIVFSPKETKYVYYSLFFVVINILLYWAIATHISPPFVNKEVNIQMVLWAIVFSFIGTVLLGIAYYRKLIHQYNYQIEQNQKAIESQNQRLHALNEHLSAALSHNNDFLQMASHDLRSPLNAVLGLTEIIKYETEREKLNQYNEYVAHSAQKALNLIENLRQVACLDSEEFQLNMQYAELGKLVEEVVLQNTVNAQKKGQIIVTNIEKNVFAQIDTLKTYQIIDNVLNNAIKYSPNNQSIWVSLSLTNSDVQIIIRDNGQGFSSEEKEKLFQKFTKLSARPTGNEISTGLGLFICKRLVEIQNGKIEAESKGKNQGSTFIVSFPVADVAK